MIASSNSPMKGELEACPEIWFHALVEIGRTYGWRIGELLNLKVKQIDLLARTIRLEPGTTKNGDGREVTMTKRVYEMLKLCAHAKSTDDNVFTRSNGKAVRDFRGTWAKAGESAECRVCCSMTFGGQLPEISVVQEWQRA